MPALDHLRSEGRPDHGSLQKVWRPRLPVLLPALPNFPENKNAAAGGGTTKGSMSEIAEFVNAGMAAQTAVDRITRPKIHIPTEEENRANLSDVLRRQRRVNAQRRDASLIALQALDRLAVVMQGRSGQPYKLRSILYSLWNGKPTSLVEIVGLDWEIRQDLVSVLLAFGFEDRQVKFFYDAVKAAVTKAGQWDWFIEEHEDIESLAEFVKSVEANR